MKKKGLFAAVLCASMGIGAAFAVGGKPTNEVKAADTHVTEDFESFSAETEYTGTKNYKNSSTGLAWTVGKGCVSSTSAIGGDNSVLVRVAKNTSGTSSTYYVKTNSDLANVKKIQFDYDLAGGLTLVTKFSKDSGSTWANFSITKVPETAKTYQCDFAAADQSDHMRFLVGFDVTSGSTKRDMHVDNFDFTLGSAATIKSIAVTSEPTKTSYYVGDSLDTTGLVITATDSESVETNVTSECTFSPSTFTVAANPTEVTVTHTPTGKTASFNVSVAEARTLNGVTVSGDMTKKSYVLDDDWDLSGLTLTGNFSTGDEDLGSLADLEDAGKLIFELSPATANSTSLTSLTISDIYYDNGVYNAFGIDTTINGIAVVEDTVTSLSWTNRGYKSTDVFFRGDVLSAVIETTKWTFKPTWISGKTDTPVLGKGADDVHLAFYADGSKDQPEASSDKWIDESYALAAEDNGKYLIASYKGTLSGSNVTVGVRDWRSIIETTSASGTFDFALYTESKQTTATNDSQFAAIYSSTDELVRPTMTSCTAVYFGNSSGGCLGSATGVGRIGKNGVLVFTFSAAVQVKSVTMGLLSWNDSEDATISVAGCSSSYTSEYNDEHSFTSHTFEISSTTNVVNISTNNARAFISYITISVGGSQEIGKTEVGLNTFDFCVANMHLEVPTTSEGTGLCKDAGWYSTAKEAFNALGDEERTLFLGNDAFASEKARLLAWASANGDHIDTDNRLSNASLVSGLMNTENTWMLGLMAGLGLIASAGLVVARKRKEN